MSIRSTEGQYMAVTHNAVDRMYSTIGNPMSLPSSLAFSLRRGGTPKIYDRIDGSYFLGESHPEANPAADLYMHSTLDFCDSRYRFFLSDSFGYPAHEGQVCYIPLREPHGHVFLPLNRSGPLELAIHLRAVLPQTKLEFRFNGFGLGSRHIPTQTWSVVTLDIPARLVERGINRLDLIHELLAADPGSRCFHGSSVCSPVDLAAVSGGPQAGTFAEIWADGNKITSNTRGLNVAVIDPTSGRVLGVRTFDVFLYAASFRELKRYLDLFAKGSIVAVALRGGAAFRFTLDQSAEEALATIGASLERCKPFDRGYVAIGYIGAPAGAAIESSAEQEHARALLGRPPPPWREIAHYRAIKLR